jgi:hypothetical protein
MVDEEPVFDVGDLVEEINLLTNRVYAYWFITGVKKASNKKTKFFYCCYDIGDPNNILEMCSFINNSGWLYRKVAS